MPLERMRNARSKCAATIAVGPELSFGLLQDVARNFERRSKSHYYFPQAHPCFLLEESIDEASEGLVLRCIITVFTTWWEGTIRIVQV